MLELFSDGPVYEYPMLINVVYSFLWSFLLSSIIAITHRFTFTGDHYPKSFFQSLILGSIVTSLVMMAIGDSLARGLGVFGAMAIIRFRTRIDDPRDVLFLFAALSAGLAIGVFGFTISFVGTLIFAGVAWLLHYTPFRVQVHQHRLLFTLPNADALPQVRTIVDSICVDARQLSVLVTKDHTVRYQFAISFRDERDAGRLLAALQQLPEVQLPRVSAIEVIND